MPFTAAEIARHVEGEVVGDPATPLAGFAPAAQAQAEGEHHGFFHSLGSIFGGAASSHASRFRVPPR